MDLNLNEVDFPYMWRVPKTALEAVYCIRNQDYKYFRIKDVRNKPTPFDMFNYRESAGKGSQFKIKPVQKDSNISELI